MDTKIKEKLTTLQTEFLSAAADIKKCSHDLSNQLSLHGLTDFKEDALRIQTAAEELARRIEVMLTARGETVSAIAADPSANGGKLRHDLRNAVGALTGYLEMVEEDLRDAGIDEDFGLPDLLSKVATMEKAISTKVRFTKARTAPKAPIDDTVERPAEQQPEAAPAPRDPTAIKGRVLVVDDDQSSRDLIATRLIRDGHMVDKAVNGREAFALMSEKEFDVILLDLMMPEMNGFEVLTRMRENGQLRQSSVIVVSGLDQEENAIKSISLGAEDYLPKPVNPVLLRARIGSSLARKQWRDQERLYRLHLEAEKTKSEALLLNTLPALVVKRLSMGEKVIADAYDNVTVLFSDFANFTGFAADHDAKDLVEILNRIFTEFDDLGADLGVEKIKTIGDGYLAAAGLPTPREDHAEVMADMALGMIDAL
ncbi:MAG TPA: adenylate cyclase, partial [Microbacterium sp.]|nr:adenylate cyclase [Microbacterium sp.]